MSLVSSTSFANQIYDVGATSQVAFNLAALGLSATINASSNESTILILTGGFKNISFGVQSTKAGTVSIQRYLDQSGIIVQGAAITGTLVANTALTVNNNDGAAFQSLKITISNSDGSNPATLSNVLLLLQSN